MSAPVQAVSRPTTPRPLHIRAHGTIQRVLSVRLLEMDPGSARQSPSLSPLSPLSSRTDMFNKPIFLPDIVGELEGNPDYTERQLVESIIMARFSTPREQGTWNAYEYLLEAYRRAEDTLRSLSSKSQLRTLLTETKDLCVSYARIVLEDASMFDEGLDTQHHLNHLAKSVHLRSGSSDGLPSGLISDLLTFCASADDGSSFDTIFGPVLNCLRSNVLKATTLDAAMPNIMALRDLVTGSTAFATMVLSHPLWIPPDIKQSFVTNANGRSIEYDTLLGPFIRPGIFPDLVSRPARPGVEPFSGDTYYTPDHEGRHIAGAVEASHGTVRQMLDLIATSLHDIFQGLLKIKEKRATVLDFLAIYLKLNVKRSRTHGSLGAVSSEGFALCLTSVFTKLCAKFSDAQPPKFNKVNSSYLYCSGMRATHAAEGMLVPDFAEQLATWKKSHEFAKPNFVTEIFYMTLNALHVGIVPAIGRYKHEWSGRRSRLADVQHALDDATTDAEKKRLGEMKVKVMTAKLCVDAHLMDKECMGSYLRFYTFVAQWLVQLSSGDTPSLPLDKAVPLMYAIQPEYFLTDFSELLVFVARYMPDVLEGNVTNTALVQCLVTFVDSQDYVTNPYIRAKMVEVMSMFAYSRIQRDSSFFNAIQCDQLSVKHLAPALMQFYVDAEDTDFYAKLDMRYNTQIVLKDLWRNPRSREGFIKASEDQRFVRFVMLLINDTTFLLDDARSGLKTIFDCKQKMAEPGWEKTMDEEAQEDLRKKLKDAEGQARASFGLVEETLNLFTTVTKDIVDPFLRPELINRLTAMLNLNIVLLVGPKAQGVQLDNPKDYGFDELGLVTQLTDIYLNLSRIMHDAASVKTDFVAAIAADERSYDYEILKLAARNLIPERCNWFLKLADVVQQAHVASIAEEADLGDIPENYLDPLLDELMRDPVKLPASGVIVDRSTITGHLLSNETDPFNREKLTLDMVVPEPALKAEIEAWVAAKRKEAAGANAQ